MSGSRPWILGISASHNGSCCLLHGDEIVVAIQEERLCGQKRARVFGARESLSLRYCMQSAGIGPGDLDMIVVSVQGEASDPINDVRLHPQLLGCRPDVPRLTIGHHRAHAVSVLATSGFSDAAVLVADGMGSPACDIGEDARAIVNPCEDGWETVTLYSARDKELEAIEVHVVPEGNWLDLSPTGMAAFHSLGGMFSAAAEQIFGVTNHAGKVMGLAPYGTPTIDADAIVFEDGERLVFPNGIQSEFQTKLRFPRMRTQYENLAASVQAALERVLLSIVARLRTKTDASQLCYAGGTALNSVANERIYRESGFEEVHIIPAAEDSGVALGAAFFGLWQLEPPRPSRRQRSDSLGHRYETSDIREAVSATPALRTSTPDDLLGAVVDRLTNGQIGGWFSGGSELGPRALGHRSIICDPRSPDAKDRLNQRVKLREMFRPFAPAVLLQDVLDWFEVAPDQTESPFMLRVAKFREGRAKEVPAVAHVDGTGRLQTVTPDVNGRFYELIERFKDETGVPILLNTSFNVRGEPIVETPEDALWCLLGTGLDFCVLGDLLISKSSALQPTIDLVPSLIADYCDVHYQVKDGVMVESGRTGAPIRCGRRSRWGRSEVLVGRGLLPLLQAIDGAKNASQLSQAIGGQLSESATLRALLMMRRSGVVALEARGATSPSA